MTRDDDDTLCYRSELEAAVKAEREACAKVCEEDICNCCWTEEAQAAAECFAAAIRARGQDPMPLFDDWGKDWK